MWTDLWYRVRAIARRTAVERELDEELRFHTERQIRKYLEAGATPEGAARRVRLEFGGLDQVKEECRAARGVGGWEEARRNLRQARRTLARRPGVAVAVVLTLALGIGANSAVFSAINAILLRPLPFPESDRLVLLEQYEPKAADPRTFVAPARLEDWQRMNGTFEAITGYYADDIAETSGELPERIAVAWVAPRFFQVWGVAPLLGRGFTPQEERFGGPRAFVITERLWRRRFGSDPQIIGRRLRAGQQSYPIVGVMPASFLFPLRDVDIWSASPSDAPFAQDRRFTWFTVVGRLRRGTTEGEAQADMDRVQAQLGREYPATDAALGVRIRPLKDVIVGGTGRSLWLLFAAVSVLLLIACTNIAALLLARTGERRREISIRYSLGASRASIVRQLLTESLILSVLGSLTGLFVAAGALRVLHRLGQNLPRVTELRLDWMLVGYSLSCAVAATFVFGLLPAMRNTRQQAGESLAHRSRTVAPAARRLHWLLAGVQVALAVPLLCGAGLLVRSFDALGRVSPGFDVERVLSFRISGNYGETADMTALSRRIDLTLDSLRALPGIEAAATALAAPGVPFAYQTDVRILDGNAAPNEKIAATTRVVSPDYFETLRIPLLTGETCPRHPASASAVVNRRFATLYLPGLAPVGRHIENAKGLLPAARIVGVVADAREEGLDREPPAIVYWCHSAPVPAPLFLVRTRTEPAALADTIRRKIHELEPRRSMYDVLPLAERLDGTLAEKRLRLTLLSAFALTAVGLAAIGLYGTLSYFVSIRRREIGVRMAVGARGGQIAASYLRQGCAVSLAGCAAGLWLAAALGRTLAGMLYGVTPLDAPTFAGVLALMIVITLCASVWPAIRAARVDPIGVLRDD